MYHPHFHIILMVNKSYFTDERVYLSQNDWTNLWKDSLKVSYTPIVDVRVFKNDKNDIKVDNVDPNKAIAETAKYAVKDGDFLIDDDLDLTDETVELLDSVLAYRRLVAFGGLMKQEHKKLNLKDLNLDKNLADEKDSDSASAEIDFVIESYRWNVGYSNYIKV